MTAATAADCITANLELLREATRSRHGVSHRASTPRWTQFAEMQVARGMLATGNPEQLRGQSLDALPWLRSRLAPLRVSELRDTGTRAPIRSMDAALWCEPRHRLGA